MKNLHLALLALITGSTQIHAESAFDPQGQYLFGDWNGKRTELANQGIKFEANLMSDTAYLADGGRDDGQDPLTSAQLWLGTQLDMGKLAGWNDVTVRAVMTALKVKVPQFVIYKIRMHLNLPMFRVLLVVVTKTAV